MESFAQLFEESLARQEMRQGEVITAEVVAIDHNFVVVNAGLKSESYVPLEEFLNDQGEIEVKEGDFVQVAIEMLEAVGVKNVKGREGDGTLGRGIHEMGTARMGHDPKTSVLNKWNQVWDAPNVFVTDGAFMTSSACQNPSLTYMAFTARAANHAVEELKKGNL